jgi:hypothetical protein
MHLLAMELELLNARVMRKRIFTSTTSCRALALAGAFALISSATLLKADPVVILTNPGDSGAPDTTSFNLASGTVVGSASSNFSLAGGAGLGGGDFTGTLFTTVLSGVDLSGVDGLPADFAANYGGLIFAYEIKNLTSGGNPNNDPDGIYRGINQLTVGGWNGFNTAIGYSRSDFLHAPGTNPVPPGETNRDNITGDSLQFHFPPDISAPPIFAGENGYSLIVFTNATSFSGIIGTLDSALYADGGLSFAGNQSINSVETLTASTDTTSVPDNGTTALLLGLGCVALGLTHFARRSGK